MNVLSIDTIVQNQHELQGYTKGVYAQLMGFEIYDSFELDENQTEPLILMKMRGDSQEMIAMDIMMFLMSCSYST